MARNSHSYFNICQEIFFMAPSSMELGANLGKGYGIWKVGRTDDSSARSDKNFKPACRNRTRLVGYLVAMICAAQKAS